MASKYITLTEENRHVLMQLLNRICDDHSDVRIVDKVGRSYNIDKIQANVYRFYQLRKVIEIHFRGSQVSFGIELRTTTTCSYLLTDRSLTLKDEEGRTDVISW